MISGIGHQNRDVAISFTNRYSARLAEPPSTAAGTSLGSDQGTDAAKPLDAAPEPVNDHETAVSNGIDVERSVELSRSPT